MKIEILSNPLSAEEIEWRVQSKNGGKTTVVPYITNRAVIKRFNEACGVLGWKSEVLQIDAIKTITYAGKKKVNKEWIKTDVMEMEGGFIASISVYNTETKEWVTKSDISDNTDIEALKGGVSGSYKRAAVHWGLGIELYEYPRVQIDGEHWYIPNWAKQRLKDITDGRLDGLFDKDYQLIKQAPPRKENKPIAAEARELTGTAWKAWKGGKIYDYKGTPCIYVDNVPYLLISDKKVAGVKDDPRYK